MRAVPDHRPRLRFVFALALVVTTTGCAQPSFDAAAEGQALLRRDAEWSKAASEGKDVERILSYFAEDAVMLEPGEPAREGKAALREYVSEMLRTPGFHIEWVSEKPEFSRDGTMAFMRGADVLTVPGPDGHPVTVHQRGVSIWRRDADGQWRCVVDIGNQPPAK